MVDHVHPDETSAFRHSKQFGQALLGADKCLTRIGLPRFNRRGIFIGPDRSGSGHTVATEGGMVDHVHPDETGLKRAEMATDPFQSLRIRPSGTLIPNTTWNAVIRYPAKFVFFQYPPPLELIHPTTNAPPRLRQTIQMRFTETRLSHKTFFRLMLLILPSSMRVATP